jgi:hypothetical protein
MHLNDSSVTLTLGSSPLLSNACVARTRESTTAQASALALLGRSLAALLGRNMSDSDSGLVLGALMTLGLIDTGSLLGLRRLLGRLVTRKLRLPSTPSLHIATTPNKREVLNRR